MGLYQLAFNEGFFYNWLYIFKQVSLRIQMELLRDVSHQSLLRSMKSQSQSHLPPLQQQQQHQEEIQQQTHQQRQQQKLKHPRNFHLKTSPNIQFERKGNSIL